MTETFFSINSLQETYDFAKKIADLAQPGDIITLRGDLGSGKTEFARAFIRCFMGPDEEVPSPTFNLVQIYYPPICPIWHFDLYRLEHPDEIWELGLEEALHGNIVLIEWPERLENYPLSNHLSITLLVDAKTQNRTINFAPDVSWQDRLQIL